MDGSGVCGPQNRMNTQDTWDVCVYNVIQIFNLGRIQDAVTLSCKCGGQAMSLFNPNTDA